MIKNYHMPPEAYDNSNYHMGRAATKPDKVNI